MSRCERRRGRGSTAWSQNANPQPPEAGVTVALARPTHPQHAGGSEKE